jgi:hypothetical protein
MDDAGAHSYGPAITSIILTGGATSGRVTLTFEEITLAGS